MPTQNRRVATYLPPHIDEKLEAFKAEQGIKGDSQALLHILSEYLGVSQEVTHLVAYDRSSKVFEQIESRLLGRLDSELLKIKADIKSELLSELRSEPEIGVVVSYEDPATPGQLEFIPDISEAEEFSVIDESKGSLPSELPEKNIEGPKTGTELSRRFGLSANAVNNQWNTSKEDAHYLFLSSQKKDPDGLGWVRDSKKQYWGSSSFDELLSKLRQ